MNLHQLLVRARDLDLHNKPERVQALKLARRILIFGRWAVCICNTLKIFVFTLKIFVSTLKIFVFTIKIFVRVDSFPVYLVRCLVAILQRGATQHRARSVECRRVETRDDTILDWRKKSEFTRIITITMMRESCVQGRAVAVGSWS